MSNQATSPVRMIRLAEVKARTGISERTLYEMEDAGTFPRRVKIGTRSVAWLEHEVEAFIQRLIDQRDSKDKK